MSYLIAEQIAQLLKPINPGRVGKDGKGFSHVEAYEIRAHLTRIFGPGRWSSDVIDMGLVFESSEERESRKDKSLYKAWTVCYRAGLRLTVAAPDGTVLATFTEYATGEATNQPSRGDAHDLAMKTAESQALKRAASNLGDQFGLSLYKKGSLKALVGRTLIDIAEGPADVPAVDGHVTDTPPENAPPPEDQRETNTRPVEEDPMAKVELIAELRNRAIVGPPVGKDAKVFFMRILADAAQAGVLAAQTADENGEPVQLKTLVERAMRGEAA